MSVNGEDQSFQFEDPSEDVELSVMSNATENSISSVAPEDNMMEDPVSYDAFHLSSLFTDLAIFFIYCVSV